MSRSTVKCMLFDLDGVIVDTAKHHFDAWCDMADELGIALVDSDEEFLKGVSRVDSLEWILQKGGLVLDSNTKLALMERKNSRYLRLIGDMGPADILPGAEEFIRKAIDLGIQIGLGSSSKNAPKILKAIGLEDLFEVVIDGNRITLSKPDPEVFLLGASAFGVAPSECLVIEDAASGVTAGKAGGFLVLGVGSSEVLHEADLIVPELKNLSPQQVLDNLCQ